MPETQVWHAQVFGPLPPPLETCTGVPRVGVQVARPCWCDSFKPGVPRLGPKVARPSVGLALACHAFDTKWHAQCMSPSGLVNWRATTTSSSGTPMVYNGVGVPRSLCGLQSYSSGKCNWRATP
ncbi:hypothetical protein AHAS_Ahas20G0173400 [Arachis hypogaea]